MATQSKAAPWYTFQKNERGMQARRVGERVLDFLTLYEEPNEQDALNAAFSCMSCAIQFCSIPALGCPLGKRTGDVTRILRQNIRQGGLPWVLKNIPSKWVRDYIEREYFPRIPRSALIEILDLYDSWDNIPEAMICCEAPCESGTGCCAGHTGASPVQIQMIEHYIACQGWRIGYFKPKPPKNKTGRNILVIGSGPGGLAFAQQMRRAGHEVWLVDRKERIGGALRFSIASFHKGKYWLEPRLQQMRSEGIKFVTGIPVGEPEFELARKGTQFQLGKPGDFPLFDVVGIFVGTQAPVELPEDFPGRTLKGVHQAINFLDDMNRRMLINAGDFQLSRPNPFDLKAGEHVLTVGGGLTGGDANGMAIRLSAEAVQTIRAAKPRVFHPPFPNPTNRYAFLKHHSEGGLTWDADVTGFEGDAQGNLISALIAINGQVERRPVAHAFIARGFTPRGTENITDQLGVHLDDEGYVLVDYYCRTSVLGVFAGGDIVRDNSNYGHRRSKNIVWAVADGRAAARVADLHLQGVTTLTSSRDSESGLRVSHSGKTLLPIV